MRLTNSPKSVTSLPWIDDRANQELSFDSNRRQKRKRVSFELRDRTTGKDVDGDGEEHNGNVITHHKQFDNEGSTNSCNMNVDRNEKESYYHQIIHQPQNCDSTDLIKLPLPPSLSATVKCAYAPLRPQLSELDEAALYWNKKNFKSFKSQAKKLSRTVWENEPAHAIYIDAFMHIYAPQTADRACEQEPNNDFLVTSDNLRVEENQKWLNKALPLALAPVRGLERYIFPGLVQDQSRVKDSVLKAQAKLPKEMDEDIRATVLASTSGVLSRPSRELARALGHADSVVALALFKKTFMPAGKKPKKQIGTTMESEKEA